jgi:5'-3' exonuclease
MLTKEGCQFIKYHNFDDLMVDSGEILQNARGKDDASSTVALVDASSHIFRYHFGYNSKAAQAARLTSESDGYDTSIQHSFLGFILSLLSAKAQRPWGRVGHVVAVFDGCIAPVAGTVPSAEGFRHQLYPEYKVH